MVEKMKKGLALPKKYISDEALKALIAFVIVIALGIIFNADGTFFKLGTHRDTLRQASIYGILACGMTMVIITGGIDLAVGSVVGLASVMFSILAIHLQLPAIVAIPAVLLIGVASGLVSGGLISYLKMQPFIATLAMMTFVRGLARFITGGKKISAYVPGPGGEMIVKPMPEIYALIDRRVLGGNLNVVSIIFFVALAVSWLVLAKHRWGRDVYAIGGNEESARLSGINVRLSKLKVYVYTGFLSALAGILQAVQETQGDPGSGTGYELTAIAMAVIGGTSMAGGKGSMALTFAGVLIIGYLEKILSINSVPSSARLMITGGIIVIAVLAQSKKK